MVGEWIEEVEYPQAPTMTKEEVVSLFEEALFARLGTINKDGTIHIAPVFFKYQEGEIQIATRIQVEKSGTSNEITMLAY
ncbi:MAG: pyridoxamine 5'-phosphate oxidase family protein [Anaerolineales bacterium]|jgi:nitroimidazol reductase NimA-like FMN-containing flavoprotein (pyridoxamine 5'-phosphate oxidase superfamily)